MSEVETPTSDRQREIELLLNCIIDRGYVFKSSTITEWLRLLQNEIAKLETELARVTAERNAARVAKQKADDERDAMLEQLREVQAAQERAADEYQAFAVINGKQLTLLTERARSAERRLAECQTQYHELLYQVSMKYPNETRHETALRYLKEREQNNNSGVGQADAAIKEQEPK